MEFRDDQHCFRAYRAKCIWEKALDSAVGHGYERDTTVATAAFLGVPLTFLSAAVF